MLSQKRAFVNRYLEFFLNTFCQPRLPQNRQRISASLMDKMPADDVIFRQSTDHEEGVSVETEKKTLRKWILLILVLLIPITAVLVALRISQAASREKR